MKRYWNGVTAHAAVTKIMYGCTLHIIYFEFCVFTDTGFIAKPFLSTILSQPHT